MGFNVGDLVRRKEGLGGNNYWGKVTKKDMRGYYGVYKIVTVYPNDNIDLDVYGVVYDGWPMCGCDSFELVASPYLEDLLEE